MSAQAETVLEWFEEQNVILNTPTGSNKSLAAMALHFASLARGRRSVYTCPIKALVNEQWMALCREFGQDNVGLSTGDANVNRDASILCCKTGGGQKPPLPRSEAFLTSTQKKPGIRGQTSAGRPAKTGLASAPKKIIKKMLGPA